jgi:hypothetical protein
MACKERYDRYDIARAHAYADTNNLSSQTCEIGLNKGRNWAIEALTQEANDKAQEARKMREMGLRDVMLAGLRDVMLAEMNRFDVPPGYRDDEEEEIARFPVFLPAK